jgi:small basic protein
MVAQESGTAWSSLIFPVHAALLIMLGNIRLYAPPRPNWVKRLYLAGFFGNFLVQGGWAILLLYNGIAVGLLALLVSILSLVGFFTFRAWPEFPLRRRLG